MSWDINQVIVVGRLTRDPELSYTQNQIPICKFSVANNRNDGKGGEDVSFFDVVAWNKVATSCSQYLRKGSQVVIDGRLNQSRFQDKTGQNRSKVEIVASLVQFVGAKSDSSQPSPEPLNEPKAKENIELKDFDHKYLGDDEVPF